LLPRHRWRRRARDDLRARAKTLRKPPAFVLGTGETISHQNISSMPDLTVTGAATSGAQAYAMAGLKPRDIDVVMVYDAFTITTLLFLEDLGFCPKGEGGRFVADGAIAPGGRLPVNTNGGGLSYCHPGMYGLFVLMEAVRQLRGECGARQVQGCADGHRARQWRSAVEPEHGGAGQRQHRLRSAPAEARLALLAERGAPLGMVVGLRQLRPDQQFHLEELLQAG
jgi:hypothetical protein